MYTYVCFQALHGEFYSLVSNFVEHHVEFENILLKSKLSARQQFVTVVNISLMTVRV